MTVAILLKHSQYLSHNISLTIPAVTRRAVGDAELIQKRASGKLVGYVEAKQLKLEALMRYSPRVPRLTALTLPKCFRLRWKITAKPWASSRIN